MNNDVFEGSVRKFLKKVGITTHQEIERAVRAHLENGGTPAQLSPVVVVKVPELDLTLEIDGTIYLE